MDRSARPLVFLFAVSMPLACGDGADAPPEATDAGSDGTAAGSDGAAESSDDGADASSGGGSDSADGDSTGTPPTCGDGIVDEGEVCDDAAFNGAYGYCGSDCSGPGPFCGDGRITDEQEECDDANEIDGDGCNYGCLLGGKMLDWWIIYASDGEADEARAIAVLSGGRFGVSGWSGSDRVPVFYAFDTSDDEAFFVFESPFHLSQAGQSISELPDGRVLWTSPGYDSADEGVALRYWFDLEHRTETHAHVATEVYPLRSAALHDGGHVLCSNAESFSLAYFGGDALEVFDWQGPGGCHAVAADSSRVVQLRGLPDGTGGPWLVQLDAYDHSGQAMAHVEYTQGVGTTKAAGVALDSAHNMVVAGTFEPSDKDSANYRPMLRKYDPSGELLWSTSPSRTKRSEWTSVAVDANDYIVTAGVVRRGNVDRGVVRKFSPEGEEIWSWEATELAGETVFNAVAIEPAGAVLVAGTYTINDTDSNILVVRLSP